MYKNKKLFNKTKKEKITKLAELLWFLACFQQRQLRGVREAAFVLGLSRVFSYRAMS
jgi:hypothetical protein